MKRYTLFLIISCPYRLGSQPCTIHSLFFHGYEKGLPIVGAKSRKQETHRKDKSQGGQNISVRASVTTLPPFPPNTLIPMKHNSVVTYGLILAISYDPISYIFTET